MRHSDFIERLGGATLVASFIGIPVQTVHSWKRADRIPMWRRPPIREMAQSYGVPLPDDFVSPPPSTTPAPTSPAHSSLTAAESSSADGKVNDTISSSTNTSRPSAAATEDVIEEPADTGDAMTAAASGKALTEAAGAPSTGAASPGRAQLADTDAAPPAEPIVLCAMCERDREKAAPGCNYLDCPQKEEG